MSGRGYLRTYRVEQRRASADAPTETWVVSPHEELADVWVDIAGPFRGANAVAQARAEIARFHGLQSRA